MLGTGHYLLPGGGGGGGFGATQGKNLADTPFQCYLTEK